MRPRTLEQLKRHLRPGRVYRREDLLPWSQSVDRHLKALTVDGTLQKLRTGLYYSPRKFEFGEAPADEHELVKAFSRASPEARILQTLSEESKSPIDHTT